MGAVYAVANQKGGVGKTTTAVNMGACVAVGGHQTLLVDLDAQCNATVALGFGRESRPSSYQCLTGEVSVAEAARPAGLDTLKLVQRELNPELIMAGVLITMHDERTRLAQDVERELRQHLPAPVFRTVIPRTIR